MTDLSSAGVLVDILDRQFAYVLGQERERFLLLLPRLTRFIERDPHLAGLVSDMRLEATEELDELAREDAALRERLASLWTKHRKAILEVLSPDLADDDKRRQINSYASLDRYQAVVRERAPLRFDGVLPKREDPGGTTALIRAFSHWAKWVRQTLEGTNNKLPGSLSGLEGELEDLAALRLHHVRRYHVAARTMAGPAFDRLCRVAQRMNPGPPVPNADVGQRLVDWARFKKAEDFAERVHTNRPKDNFVLTDDVDVVCHHASEDAALVHDELRTRVLLARSRLALVQKYAARCEAFDGERLRKVAGANTANAERLLTLDFARYLFDQGLTPLIDPTLGGLRPDVLHVGTADLFYAEAKQYAGASPRSALVKAYRQVWGTWGRLRSQFTVPEAFLVVFRRSGPRVELPPVIHFRGMRLYSVLADLDTNAGSRERARPISIDPKELVPEDVTRSRRKRRT